MSERLKSKYLRKREEISSNSRKYFIAGFLFSFFLLFLFYQFRSIILKPTFACEEPAKTFKISENAELAQSKQNQKLSYKTHGTFARNFTKKDIEIEIKEISFQNDELNIKADVPEKNGKSNEVTKEILSKKHEVKQSSNNNYKHRITLHRKNAVKTELRKQIERRMKLN